MAFQGSLKELPLPDIIQLVSVSGKTGAFVLESGGQRGEIFLRDGEIVHAVINDLQGEEAVYELAIWQEGQFEFNPGVVTEARTVKKSNTNLLMEAARRIDEWKVLSKRIPSTRLVPVFTNRGSSTSVSFTPHEWAIICKIDERRSIEGIASVLSMSAFEACKLLYGLVTAGLVELTESLGGEQAERLESMTPDQLSAAVAEIEAQAQDLLRGDSKLSEVESTSRRARNEMESGRGADAVIDLIRSLERLVSGALGPNQSRVFLERVNQLLSA